MIDNNISVRLELKTSQIKEELQQLISSIDGYKINNSDNPGYCDLLILEIGDDIKNEFDFFRSLKDTGEIKEAFLTSSNNGSDILIRALRAGAKEFFTQPLDKQDVISSLMKFRDKLQGNAKSFLMTRQGKLVNVIGSKGGVGTTTLAVNIATFLNESKGVKSVALIDMNLLFGDIPLFLDIKTNFNWGEVLKNISRLDSTYLMSGLTRHSSGIYILPSPSDVNGIHSAKPETIEQVLTIIKNEFDYIVIDNGQSINKISLKILELSDTVLLVSIPSLPCLINVKKLLNTFLEIGYPDVARVKIIMNRNHRKSVVSIKEAEESIGTQIAWQIPNDYNATISAINQGKALSEAAKKAKITKNIKELTDILLKGNNNKIKRGFLGKKLLSK